MRCISRAKSAALVCVASISLFTGGCIGGKGATPVTAYELKNYNQDLYQGKLYAEELCVAQNDVALEGYTEDTELHSAALFDLTGERVLYSYKAHERLYPASTTKIMTCILALENSKMNETVKFSARATALEPTKLYARTGETFYMRDLLYSLMVPSHNDTAAAIAEHISGSQSKFVSLMNKKAAQLGCTDTHFATPNGLDAGYTHYTTASDLAKIARYAIKKPAFRKIISTKSYSFKSLNTNRRFTVSTTNALLGNMPGVIGMKTGYTNKAGHCFVGLCQSQKGNTYISVVLGGPNSNARWRDSRILLNYAYKH